MRPLKNNSNILERAKDTNPSAYRKIDYLILYTFNFLCQLWVRKNNYILMLKEAYCSYTVRTKKNGK